MAETSIPLCMQEVQTYLGGDKYTCVGHDEQLLSHVQVAKVDEAGGGIGELRVETSNQLFSIQDLVPLLLSMLENWVCHCNAEMGAPCSILSVVIVTIISLMRL